MIPRLNPQKQITDTIFLAELAQTPFSGEIRDDFASRLISSTDNSIYQILPQAVVFPKCGEDLVYLFKLASQEQFKNITFSPRGGGTGTNGQSLSSGIIIDCSKYMNQILEVNWEAGWVRVQPGVVLDQLNAKLQPQGWFFAPSLSPSNRATIGGMINTDACGKGSRIYGRTSDHILELSWILADGTVGTSKLIDTVTLATLKQDSGPLGKIYRQVDQIVTSKRELIEQTFPKMSRFMTGYNLAKVYSHQGNIFDLNRILAGSEGTLAFITEAKLRLTKIPDYKQLLVIHYSCFDDALQAAQILLKFQPVAIETIDETILNLAKEDEIYLRVKDFLGDAKTINLIEFVDDNDTKLTEKVVKLCQNLESQGTQYYLAQNETEIAQLWELRKRGVGLLGNKQGERKPIAFMEDTAVPPSCLASYIQELKVILNEYNLEYAMFGHVDVGCLHVRPALDLKVSQDEALIRSISDQVVALVRKYGGVMWAEHGKGFRSEYTPVFFGEELYEDLRKIKAAFDPNNKLNPGKIVTPAGSLAKLVRLESPFKGHFDRQVSSKLRSEYEAAFSCNGNGACFNFNPDEVMCPSAKQTRDRIHSPKGRASLLREWLRQLSLTPSPPHLFTFLPFFKLWNTLTKFWGIYDFSHEVYEGMAGCLSCKACASQCPIHVDVPDLKARFLELYYTRYLRPWRDYFISQIETLAKWQSHAPKLVNMIGQNPVTRWSIKQFLGMVDPPVVSTYTVKQGLAARKAAEFDLIKLSNLSEVERKNTVILLQDAFTSFYESQLVLHTYDFLSYLGYTVYVAPFLPSGKPLQVKGFLREFNAIVEKNAAYLTQLAELGIPLIGIEPSILLTYREEYSKLINIKDNFKIQLLQEFLVTQKDKIKLNTQNSESIITYYLFGHCTEKTAALESQKQWQQVFQAIGLKLNLVATGCCGMAGIYGHEAEHYASSEEIFQLSWGQHFSSIKTDTHRECILVTGYSCRSQVKRFAGWMPKHPVQVLLTKSKSKLSLSPN